MNPKPNGFPRIEEYSYINLYSGREEIRIQDPQYGDGIVPHGRELTFRLAPMSYEYYDMQMATLQIAVRITCSEAYRRAPKLNAFDYFRNFKLYLDGQLTELVQDPGIAAIIATTCLEINQQEDYLLNYSFAIGRTGQVSGTILSAPTVSNTLTNQAQNTGNPQFQSEYMAKSSAYGTNNAITAYLVLPLGLIFRSFDKIPFLEGFPIEIKCTVDTQPFDHKVYVHPNNANNLTVITDIRLSNVTVWAHRVRGSVAQEKLRIDLYNRMRSGLKLLYTWDRISTYSRTSAPSVTWRLVNLKTRPKYLFFMQRSNVFASNTCNTFVRAGLTSVKLLINNVPVPSIPMDNLQTWGSARAYYNLINIAKDAAEIGHLKNDKHSPVPTDFMISIEDHTRDYFIVAFDMSFLDEGYLLDEGIVDLHIEGGSNGQHTYHAVLLSEAMIKLSYNMNRLLVPTQHVASVWI